MVLTFNAAILKDGWSNLITGSNLKTPDPYVIIGSGPAGVAAALALVNQGCAVIMLDVGHELSQEGLSRASSLGNRHHNTWTTEDRKWLTANIAEFSDKVPLKSLFGQDFPYKNHEWVVEKPFPPAGFAQYPSHGYGGLSRVWGATTMRLHSTDFASWPLSKKDLEPHYQAILSLIPVTSELDDLSEEYGCAPCRTSLPLSPQADLILNRMKRNRSALLAVGFLAGRSRIAVAANCTLCGACMHGCPYDQIFSSTHLMPSLIKNPLFKYQPGLRAVHLEENINETRVICLDKLNTQHSVIGARVFVGAGVLGTTRLILASRDAWDKVVTLRDSQYFLLPFIGPRGNTTSPHQTLSQIFGKINQPSLSSRTLHVQYYTYNDLYLPQILKSIGPLRYLPGASLLAQEFARRMVIVQGYLPSIESNSATIRLSGARQQPVLSITPHELHTTSSRTTRVWRYLAKIGQINGLTALSFMGQQTEVGRGYHSGATFPMARNPELWQSDSLGRTDSLKKIHIIDASAWPDIPSGPVTLTVMANAHRIASDAFAIDRSQSATFKV